MSLSPYLPMLQVDGVSVTSRVVVNGTRFGACYNNRTFQANNYSAYITSREENGLTVRGNEALLVWGFSGVRWRMSCASNVIQDRCISIGPLPEDGILVVGNPEVQLAQ